ncbi:MULTISPECIES: helix-turn-helix transcriptional regulator [Kitasatospora]|uniref:Putative transcriptional regulator n=1 Tax=Kitasatospora setae (strain ATCC 33774 / DSM 43861 / JCM 3304 / KCC A-0304 / NBRC 14216 / KM-6054) TaxID=452652 RepID=E4N0L4_KITSK|nr:MULTISPECIES: helix-turn-helix transcriptional regulator [Kitasatospora]BAJ31698.1 putative transcriptional regulator [Kitasatospora setae KM-6054]
MPPYTPSSSVVAARRALAERLRDLRRDAGITGDELSARCGWNPAKTSRLQAGKAAPSEADIRAWCRACGAEEQVPELIAASRAVESMYVEWRRLEAGGLRQAQDSVLDLYRRTRRFRVYASRTIPGMVQTRAYTEAVLRAVQRSRGTVDDVDAAVEARMARQRMVFSGGATFALLVEESVLRGAVCDAETMDGQLGHLIAVSTLPQVSLGVIPLATGRTRSPAEDFYLFDDVQTSVELVSGHLRLTQRHELEMYAGVFTELSRMARFGAEARALIASAIDRRRR